MLTEWIEYSLGDLIACDFDGAWGGEAKDSEGIIVLRSTDMRNRDLSFKEPARRSVPTTVVRKKHLIDGDILVNKSSGSAHLVGKSVLFYSPDDQKYLCSNFIRCLRPNLDKVTPELLYFALQSPQFQSQIFGAHRTTSGLRNIKINEFKAGLLKIPNSITEQSRIISRIRECFEQVDEIESLTNLQDSDEKQLLRAAKREYLGNPEQILPGWNELRLDQLADVIYGISAAISKNNDPNLGPPIIRMANISLNGQLDLTDLRYCLIPKGRLDHFALKKGDLLLNWRSGSAQHVGKTALFEGDGLYTCASFILRIRAYPGKCDNRYLRHVLNFMRSEGVFSGQSRMQINHKLNAKEFSAIPIRVPPTSNGQTEIADHLDAIEEYSLQLNKGITNRQEGIKVLRESILRKAFAGEL